MLDLLTKHILNAQHAISRIRIECLAAVIYTVYV